MERTLTFLGMWDSSSDKALRSQLLAPDPGFLEYTEALWVDDPAVGRRYGQHLTSERLVKRQWRMSRRFRPMPTRILVEPAPALIPAEQMDEVAPEELETAEAVKAVAALEELETAEAIEAVAAMEAVAATTAREVAWG